MHGSLELGMCTDTGSNCKLCKMRAQFFDGCCDKAAGLIHVQGYFLIFILIFTSINCKELQVAAVHIRQDP